MIRKEGDFEPDKEAETSQPPPKKRRRVPEACHVCRRRKAKCDGGRPCSYCKSTNQECVFDPSHPISGPLDKSTAGSLNDMVKNLQERVKFLESKIGPIPPTLDVSSSGRPWNVVSQNLVQQRAPQDNSTLFIEFGAGVSTLNSGTRNIEFYGATSSYAFAATRALFHSSNTPAKITALSPSHDSPTSSKASPDYSATKFMSIEDMGMQELLLSNDTPMPDQFDPFMPSGPSLYDASITLERRDTLDRHIDSFFNCAHTLFPIFHEGAFRKLYGVFWKEIERKENRKDQLENGRDALDAGVMPLVFAVACHGALYSTDSVDKREWARSYFARARRWLSVFETGSFETMIAMYLLALYAQHVFKINLAYNYLGLAIRLSYSIGLHVFNPGTSDKTIATAACWPGVSKPIIGEMAKRIWWSMYALEVESSLNCGRPMCIRNQDIYIGNPSIFDDDTVDCSEIDIPQTTQPTRVSYLIEMAKFSRIVRKVLKVSYSAESTKLSFGVWTEELHNLTLELAEWKEALPLHLRTASTDEFEEPFWVARQRESTQYHYHHVLLTMYREFLNAKKPFSNSKLSSETGVQRCVDAARENIVLIRDCLAAYPSLRNWTHLYYYLLSASLVFIDRLNQAPFDQRALDYTRCCGLATEAFKWMRPLGGTDKIIAIIKNCLDEWEKRRDAKQRKSSNTGQILQNIAKSPARVVESDNSDTDTDTTPTRGTPESPRPRDHCPVETLPASPSQTPFGPRRSPALSDAGFGPLAQLHPENSNQPFLTTQLFPDFYLNGLSLNHAFPGSPYEPMTALLNSDLTPTSTSQFRVSRVEGIVQGSSRQEDEDHNAYTPSERIERMFGINPSWR